MQDITDKKIEVADATLVSAVLLLCLCGPSWALTPAPLDRDELRLSLAPYMEFTTRTAKAA